VEEAGAGRHDFTQLGKQVGDCCEAEGDALVGGLAQIEWRCLEREPSDRATRVGVPAGRALAAQERQKHEPVIGRIALRERSR
jgi:hypothetical protein